jgi:hypothetical protein
MADAHDYSKGWIGVDLDGVDLDGTLARNDGKFKDWKGYEFIGDPVPDMVARVQQALDEGKHLKIFTARAFEHGLFKDGKHIDAFGPIERWCEKHLGVILEITCTKDPGCVEIWDDRARQAVRNRGVLAPHIVSVEAAE